MLKKILLSTIFAATIMSNNSANAFGNLWYDLDSRFGEATTIAVLPIEDLVNNRFRYDENVIARLQKDMKKIEFIPIVSGQFQQRFENESERAAAIYELTGAEYYIAPRIFQNHFQTDVSPEKTVTVTLKTYMKISGSPDGQQDGTYDERSWNEYHTIPSATVYFRMMELDYTLYDSEGNEVFMFDNKAYEHTSSEQGILNKLTKDFSDVFEDVKNDNRKAVKKRDKNDKKGKKSKKKEGTVINLSELQMPESMSADRFLSSAAKFAYLHEGEHRLKKFTISEDKDPSAKYEIVGRVANSSYDFKWYDPYVTTSDKIVHTDSYKWKDSEDKEHTETRDYYETEISDHYGGWGALAHVSASFRLLDAKTGRVLVEYSDSKSDDKEIDAFHHILKKFYEKANKYLKDAKS